MVGVREAAASRGSHPFSGIRANHMDRWTGLARGVALSLLCVGVVGVGWASAQDKPKHTVKEIMAEAHKGDTALIRKATTGKATPAELKTLAGYYKEMALLPPPKGDAASWKVKTAALSKAADALAAGNASAAAQLRTASNCKSCHAAHRPE